MTTRLAEFVANAVRSGLVEPEAAGEAARGLRDDDPQAPAEAARRLVDRELLTEYQARKLLAGVTAGFLLGHYRILKPIATGGSSQVFLARDDRDARRVALKVLPPRRNLARDAAEARYRREWLVSTRVNHPRLARALELATHGNLTFLVVEFAPGEPLEKVVRAAGTWSPRRAARYFKQVCDGLAALHAAGVVHRDLKPANLIVSPMNEATILDLGSALVPGVPSPPVPPDGVVGTLDYVAPEQIDAPDAVGPAADLYSVGCCLHFTLAGAPPFEGGSSVNKVVRHKYEPPPPLPDHVPPEFAAIVFALLAKNPDDRPQNAGEARRLLHRWLKSQSANNSSEASSSSNDALPANPAAPPDDLDDIGFVDDWPRA